MSTDDPGGSLNRGVAILKLLASAGHGGLALTQVSQRCGIPHSSAHRVLSQLRSAGLVHQIAESGTYALGPLAFELGIAAAGQFDIRGRSRQAMTSLANKLGDTAYLFLRSGSEAVCLDRLSGHSPIRVVSLRIGSRRPLGLGSGGLAILTGLPEDEREEVLRDVSSVLTSEWGIEEKALRRMVAAGERNGYVFIQDQITVGVSSVGTWIVDTFGETVGAVGLAAAASRMPASRVAEVAEAVTQAARQIEVSLFARKLPDER